MSSHPLDDAQVNQARFLAAGDDVDAATQCGFGNHQEGVRVFHAPEGLGSDRAEIVLRDAAQPLTEAGKTL